MYTMVVTVIVNEIAEAMKCDYVILNPRYNGVEFREISREVSRFLAGPRELTRSRGKQHGRSEAISQTSSRFLANGICLLVDGYRAQTGSRVIMYPFPRVGTVS